MMDVGSIHCHETAHVIVPINLRFRNSRPVDLETVHGSQACASAGGESMREKAVTLKLLEEYECAYFVVDRQVS